MVRGLAWFCRFRGGSKVVSQGYAGGFQESRGGAEGAPDERQRGPEAKRGKSETAAGAETYTGWDLWCFTHRLRVHRPHELPFEAYCNPHEAPKRLSKHASPPPCYPACPCCSRRILAGQAPGDGEKTSLITHGDLWNFPGSRTCSPR